MCSLKNQLLTKYELEHDLNFAHSEIDRLSGALEDRNNDYGKLRQQHSALEKTGAE
jgi:hypothetical protein